ncbi:conserved hypothetical protein [Talaromyces stipitatus ATCC 10500]|uniref:N-acetylglucosamine-induced protein 1 n=1 Tax=Talaromyces stipitatus (strain ATCC 10500 / CBS 375.48 / QM 6759 / NRRL 1006) TaxID=441959 RepID=B8M5H2_TALSN|nr:uncharacterized protein TSTA_030440 [Talaromyces stipitatus ATCC 10500]EED19778.1 conserved hypothetical protein [Talaromyces stipitatus ATCC 10500]
MGSVGGEQPTEQKSTPFNLTEVDRQVLAQTDEEFVYHDWEDLKGIIARNDLAILRRKPSDLRRYITWTNDIKSTHGSITKYICLKRLQWWAPHPSLNLVETPIPEIPFKNPTPFADPSDYKVLRNDWPYGVTPDITHIVVWSKTPIATKPENGDVTDESRALIEGFVDRTFVQRLEKDPVFEGVHKDVIRNNHVLWFKNWTALQSVRSLEHFHVLVRGVPDAVITEWTDESGVVR